MGYLNAIEPEAHPSDELPYWLARLATSCTTTIASSGAGPPIGSIPPQPARLATLPNTGRAQHTQPWPAGAVHALQDVRGLLPDRADMDGAPCGPAEAPVHRGRGKRGHHPVALRRVHSWPRSSWQQSPSNRGARRERGQPLYANYVRGQTWRRQRPHQGPLKPCEVSLHLWIPRQVYQTQESLPQDPGRITSPLRRRMSGGTPSPPRAPSAYPFSRFHNASTRAASAVG